MLTTTVPLYDVKVGIWSEKYTKLGQSVEQL